MLQQRAETCVPNLLKAIWKSPHTPVPGTSADTVANGAPLPPGHTRYHCIFSNALLKETASKNSVN